MRYKRHFARCDAPRQDIVNNMCLLNGDTAKIKEVCGNLLDKLLNVGQDFPNDQPYQVDGAIEGLRIHQQGVDECKGDLDFCAERALPGEEYKSYGSTFHYSSSLPQDHKTIDAIISCRSECCSNDKICYFEYYLNHEENPEWFSQCLIIRKKDFYDLEVRHYATQKSPLIILGQVECEGSTQSLLEEDEDYYVYEYYDYDMEDNYEEEDREEEIAESTVSPKVTSGASSAFTKLNKCFSSMNKENGIYDGSDLGECFRDVTKYMVKCLHKNFSVSKGFQQFANSYKDFVCNNEESWFNYWVEQSYCQNISKQKTYTNKCEQLFEDIEQEEEVEEEILETVVSPKVTTGESAGPDYQNDQTRANGYVAIEEQKIYQQDGNECKGDFDFCDFVAERALPGEEYKSYGSTFHYLSSLPPDTDTIDAIISCQQECCSNDSMCDPSSGVSTWYFEYDRDDGDGDDDDEDDDERCFIFEVKDYDNDTAVRTHGSKKPPMTILGQFECEGKIPEIPETTTVAPTSDESTPKIIAPVLAAASAATVEPLASLAADGSQSASNSASLETGSVGEDKSKDEEKDEVEGAEKDEVKMVKAGGAEEDQVKGVEAQVEEDEGASSEVKVNAEDEIEGTEDEGVFNQSVRSEEVAPSGGKDESMQ